MTVRAIPLQTLRRRGRRSCARRPSTVSTCRLCCARCAIPGDEGAYVRPTWFWSIVINTFYYSGIRRLQLVGLTWKDIDFDSATIHLRATSSKTHREWFIPIAQPLRPELENLYLLTTERLWSNAA